MQNTDSKWADIFAEKFEVAFKETGSYFLNEAVSGWQYTYVMEEPFIDSALNSHKRPPAETGKSIGKMVVPVSDLSAAEYLQKIAAIEDITVRWDYVRGLTQAENTVLLADDFIDVQDEELKETLASALSLEGLNVLIIGAGCVGLYLANMLKTALGDDINILMVESRIQARHIKEPYIRNWLTSIPRDRLDILDPHLQQAAGGFGQQSCMGLSINVFETLLFLSCRSLGVKFLFDEKNDLSFVERSGVHLVFDATGGRFPALPGLVDGPTAAVDKEINLKIPAVKNFAANTDKYGIKGAGDVPPLLIKLQAKQGGYYPHVDGRQIKTAMMKIVNIPMSFYRPLLECVKPMNEDRLIYLWPGTLREEFNHFLMFMNLLKPAYDGLAEFIDGPMPLSSFIERGGLDVPDLDSRVAQLVEAVDQSGANLDTVMIEPPFLYAPYLHKIDKLRRLYGHPVMPLGDSVYNGNPKAGNGLGPHLRYVHNLQHYIVQLYESLKH